MLFLKHFNLFLMSEKENFKLYTFGIENHNVVIEILPIF